MFTGIIEEMGELLRINKNDVESEFVIRAGKVIRDMEIGHSIAVNGVCLTVISFSHDWFSVTAVRETLQKSTLGELKPGDYVNLERSMAGGGRFHGHIVQGHVDAVGRIVSINKIGSGAEISILIPEESLRYCVLKGSVAIDGISLTIAEMQGNVVKIAVIPHTFRETTLVRRKIGDYVNIETDIVGRYIEKFLEEEISEDSDELTADKLAEWGYGES